MTDFQSFPKIPRLNKMFNCVVTEKIDGTNAQIFIEGGKLAGIGSRNRWITPEQDNFGFARWIMENEAELLTLGDGRHFGEWYGSGIQRGYGLSEKRFALFNSHRWTDERPACCDVVPVLFAGKYDRLAGETIIEGLEKYGSQLVPGFMKPEGFIAYFPEIKQNVKWTFEHSEGKWKDE